MQKILWKSLLIIVGLVSVVGLAALLHNPFANIRIARAATVTAASCSAANVQAAINSANSGDTVTIPGGTCTWSSAVTIPSTKGITLSGGGNTTINDATDGLMLNSNATTPTRITGITFSGPFNGENGAITVSGCGGLTDCGGAMTAFYRIDDNTFIDPDYANESDIMLSVSGNGPGLVDHNSFTVGAGSETIHNLGMGAGDASGWTDSVTPGGPYMLYIETNTFTYPASGNPAYDWGTQAIESFYGARNVFRYNTLNMMEIDQHGTGGEVWSRWWEIYNNTFNTAIPNSAQSTYITLRGGSGVVFNNTHVGTNTDGSPDIEFWVECGGAGTQCTSSDSYPQLYQIGRGINQAASPVYLWNNTDPQNGGSMAINSDSPLAQANRDYYISASEPSSMKRDELSTDNAATTYVYTPFTYPFPLTASGMPNPSGGGSSDTTPPSVPTGLTAGAVTTSTVALSWTASTDNVGVAGYNIFRNGTQIGTTANTSYTDTGLSSATTYSYTVSAYDAAGNASAQSTGVNATTQSQSSDTTPPTVSLTAPANNSTVSGTVTISANASDNVAVASVSFSVDGTVVDTDASAPYSFAWNSASVANGTHTITATAVDTSGNRTTTPSITVTVSNSVQSSAIALVQSVASAFGGDTSPVKVTFSKTTTAGDTILVWTTDGKGSGLTTTVKDNAGNTYTPTTAEIYNTGCSQAQQLFYASNIVATSTPLTVTVTFSSAADAAEAFIYEYSGLNTASPLDATATLATTDVANASTPSVTVSGNPDLAFSGYVGCISSATAGANYTLQISDAPDQLQTEDWKTATSAIQGMWINAAQDSTIILSTFKAAGSSTSTPDTTPPTTSITSPTNNATVSGVITVTASASDNVGVTQVQLYIDGILSGTDTTSPYAFSLNTTSLSNGTHTLQTKASDAAGNVGSSAAVSVTVNNTTITKPSITSALSTAGTVGSSFSYQISASNSPTSYTASGLPSGLSLNGSTGVISGTPTSAVTSDVTLNAINSAGTGSATLVLTVANAPDTTPPSVPTNLTMLGDTTSSIAIAWSPSTDNVGVTGYKVYRNSTQVGNVSTPAFTDINLTPSSTYSYTVSAYDAAGNQSSQSASLTASTEANPASNSTSTASSTPTIPSIISFTANPGSITEGQSATLSWIASGTPTAALSLNNGIGPVSGASIQVSPSETTTYTLTANNGTGNATAEVTVTVTSPSTNTGSSSGGGGGGGSSGGGSSGGGGGGGYTPPAPSSPGTTSTGSSGSSSLSSSSSSLASLLQSLLLEVQSLIAKLNAQLVTSFTRNLTIGSEGQDVKNLQVFLNDNGYTIASSGSGSPGDESTYFGAKTSEALAKFQAASGLPATGFMGPLTRQYLEGKW